MKSVKIACFILMLFVLMGNVYSAEQKVKLGFLVKQPEELWFQNEWKFAQKFADEVGIDLIKIGTTDGEKVMTAIDNLATQKVQGFVICTPDVRLGPAIIKKANSKNLKVFTVDDRFVGADGNPVEDVPYMGISSTQIGFDIGKACYEEAKKRGWNMNETGAMVVTHDELETIKQRTDAEKDALIKAGFPANNIFTAVNKTLDVPGGMDGANVTLTQNPTIKKWLVAGGNEESVIGAVRALEGKGFDGDTTIASALVLALVCSNLRNLA